MSDKKFYWLKLKKDFFKRHDIRIITGLPDGELIVLFYLKLMLESVDHEGELRFSEKIPYTPEMLATITDTKIEVVERSLEVLKNFGILKIKKDGTIVIEKVKTLVGFETQWAEKKRVWRETQKSKEDNVLDVSSSCPPDVLDVSSPCPIRDRDRVRDRDRDIKRNSKEKKFQPPTLEEVKSYCLERKSNVDPVKFYDYYSTGNWKDAKGNPVKNWKQKLITWEKKNEPTTAPQPIPQKRTDWISDYYERAGMIAPREGGTSNDT